MAEKAPGWTPYRYAFNNPIRIIDPDGQFETKFAARLYNALHGFKGKVHESLTRPGEYYVGREIKSSTEARYDIKWSGNSERPGGGLINAIDKIPKMKRVFGSHAKDDVLIPHGENIGKGMQYTGDAVELGGWATAAAGGSGMLGVFAGKAISIFGMAIENISRYAKDGNTLENKINLGIDIGIDVILPAPLEDAIDRSGLGSTVKAQARGILSAETKLIKEQVKQSIDDQ